MTVSDHIAPSATLETELLKSHFLARGGAVVLQGLFDTAALDALRREAAGFKASAGRSQSAGSGSEDWRGGDPARAYWGTPGGPVQWGLLTIPGVGAALSKACGLEIQMTGGGSYSYYAEPGDFLAVHRDIVRCDLALLTCLEETRPSGADRGALQIYPACAALPLSRLRSNQCPARVEVALLPGESVLLLGGIIPHEVTPMIEGQQRTMSVACFRLVQ